MKVKIPTVVRTAKQMDGVALSVAKGVLSYLKGQRGPQSLDKIGPNKNPHWLKMELLEMFVRAIPKEYMEVEHFSGHQRLFASGTYKIVKPIPSEVIISTFKKAGVLA